MAEAFAPELNIQSLPGDGWNGGASIVFPTLSAYNDMPELIHPGAGQPVNLIGLGVGYPAPDNTPERNSAYYLIRHRNATYEWERVFNPAVPAPNPTADGLRATRAARLSPFPEDRGRVLFFSGFDAASNIGAVYHNTAWIYRAELPDERSFIRWEGGGPDVGLGTAQGWQYQLRYPPDFSQWFAIGPALNGSNAPQSILVIPAPGKQRQFYRWSIQRPQHGTLVTCAEEDKLTPMSRLHRRDALKLTAAGVAVATLAPAALAASRPGVPGPRTEVRRHRGQPQFILDGRPYTKPVFETYVPEMKYFRQFAEAGTDVFCFSTNLGPGFGAPTWLGPDQWDFKALDELAHRVLEANPRGLLLPRVYLTAPDWWVKANPDECQVLSHGGKNYRLGLGHGRDGKAFPSLASDKWRDDTATALQRVIRHMQESDYGRQLFGYMVTGLMSEEWYHWSIHTEELSDYSSHATRVFRAWLRAKYRTANALRAAWNHSRADFDRAVVPSLAMRQASRNARTFRDPATEMPVIDWYLFYNDLIPDTMDCFCRAAKEASDFKKVVGAFYCYMFEFGGDPEFGHNALTRLLRSKHLDFAVVTASYHDRDLGRGADYARAPVTSLGLHGKLWYHDNDTVSFRYDTVNAANPDRATVARYRKELGVTETAQETIWQYRRGVGFVLGHGIYQSFFDLHGGYFDDPVLMAEVKRLNALLDESKQHDCSSVAEILVVSDEPSCSYATFESGFLQQTLQPAQVQLAKLGAPHDSILVDDLALADIKRYRLVIFLNCFHLTDAQRALIRRKVLTRRRTVLWCYAPGLFNGPKASVEAMFELTGLRITRSENSDRVRLRLALTDEGISLLERGVHTPSVPHVPTTSKRPEGRAPGKSVIGHEHVWGQRFFVEDPQAIALGHVEGRDEVAFAMKRLKDWTSIYTLNPVLPAAFLRALARHAGVHIYNDRDDTLYASRSYLCLNAEGPGERALHFPKAADLFDAFTGQLLARRVTAFLHALQDKETLLIRYRT